MAAWIGASSPCCFTRRLAEADFETEAVEITED